VIVSPPFFYRIFRLKEMGFETAKFFGRRGECKVRFFIVPDFWSGTPAHYSFPIPSWERVSENMRRFQKSGPRLFLFFEHLMSKNLGGCVFDHLKSKNRREVISKVPSNAAPWAVQKPHCMVP
jgi:hypothetical protein